MICGQAAPDLADDVLVGDEQSVKNTSLTSRPPIVSRSGGSRRRRLAGHLEDRQAMRAGISSRLVRATSRMRPAMWA